jgi:hypothetical protein
MDELERLSFSPWPDPLMDPFGQHPDGDWSRLAWLPVIGPTSWLVWGTLTRQLRHDPQVTWDLAALAVTHGLVGGTGPSSVIRRTIGRLCQFHILAPHDGADRYLVRMTAPPLSQRQLRRLPDWVAELQRQIFFDTTPRRTA